MSSLTELKFSHAKSLEGIKHGEKQNFDSGIILALANAVGVDLVVELEKTFVIEATNQLQNMTSALEQLSFEQVSKSAHSLKSSAATLGCMGLADLLQAIELKAKATQFEELPILISQLPGQLEASLESLSKSIKCL